MHPTDSNGSRSRSAAWRRESSLVGVFVIDAERAMHRSSQSNRQERVDDRPAVTPAQQPSQPEPVENFADLLRRCVATLGDCVGPLTECDLGEDLSAEAMQ